MFSVSAVNGALVIIIVPFRWSDLAIELEVCPFAQEQPHSPSAPPHGSLLHSFFSTGSFSVSFPFCCCFALDSVNTYFPPL